MRERVPMLLFIVSALALGAAAIAAVDHVRASDARRTRAAERAREQSRVVQRQAQRELDEAQRERDEAQRELDAIDAGLTRALEDLRRATDAAEREQRGAELMTLQRRYFYVKRSAVRAEDCARRRSHCVGR